MQKNQTNLNNKELVPEISQNNKAPSSVPPQFIDWMNNIKQADDFLTNDINNEEKSSPVTLAEPDNRGDSAIIISKEMIFARLWPESYLKILNEWQEAMINDGFLKESEKSDFKTSEKIYAFLEKSVDYWVKVGIIGILEKDGALRGIEKLKILKKQEVEEFIRNKGGQSPACQNKFGIATLINSSKIPQKIKEFYLWKFTVPAFAKINYILGTDCWKLGAGVGPICGASLWSPCCSCYCGELPCGCLNAVCSCCNAIWDSVSGICGCDIIGNC